MAIKPALFVAMVALSFSLPAQNSANRVVAQPTQAPESRNKRMFGIIPNNRTSPSLANYKPLTASQKFKLATRDAFDPGTFLLAGVTGGIGQWTNANPSFGQGAKGYARYFGTSYGDWAIGDYMTEAVYPVLLHQDPRYFRKGTGSGFSRLKYAVGQIFWTHTDSGGHMFNFSEICGNATAVAISQAYYPDNRTASNALSRLGVQVGVDMAGNILKEFYPEMQRMLSRKHGQGGSKHP